MQLVSAVLEGNRLALARLLTQVENDTDLGRQALEELFPHTGRAHLIGVTGSPGTGKSSLVNQLARSYRHLTGNFSQYHLKPLTIAIIAVDPTSPFSGGAILGDRVRMKDLAGDPGVFIRSCATRGSLGGLARKTTGLVQVFDAAGYDVILIETVGAGQAEVDIARLAHTTLVVEAPGLGDEIQAIKAGILEIADILVINKADRPGVEATERALRSMLQLAHPVPHVFLHHGKQEIVDLPHKKPDHGEIWLPPIQRTVATEAVGLEELIQAIDKHHEYLLESGEWHRREQARLQAELDQLLQESLLERWRSKVSEDIYTHVLGTVVRRQISPWQAVQLLVDKHSG
jgi:LAO/AO transport system kinase